MLLIHPIRIINCCTYVTGHNLACFQDPHPNVTQWDGIGIWISLYQTKYLSFIVCHLINCHTTNFWDFFFFSNNGFCFFGIYIFVWHIYSMYFMRVIHAISTISLLWGTVFVQENNQLWKNAFTRWHLPAVYDIFGVVNDGSYYILIRLDISNFIFFLMFWKSVFFFICTWWWALRFTSWAF